MYVMIWSMNKAELTRQVKQLEKGEMLTRTKDRTADVANAEPVNYFVLPPSKSSHGRAVVSFTHLLSSGHLDSTVPFAFGVITQPLSEEDKRRDNEVAVKMTQENHVLAEYLALKMGVFTPYGRETAEALVLNKLMPKAPRAEFAALRIAHIGALLETLEIDTSMTQSSQDRIAFELQRAQKHLESNY